MIGWRTLLRVVACESVSCEASPLRWVSAEYWTAVQRATLCVESAVLWSWKLLPLAGRSAGLTSQAARRAPAASLAWLRQLCTSASCPLGMTTTLQRSRSTSSSRRYHSLEQSWGQALRGIQGKPRS